MTKYAIGNYTKSKEFSNKLDSHHAMYYKSKYNATDRVR